MMNPLVRFGAIAALIGAGAGVAALGQLESQIGFDSVREIWGDLVRDADQMALKAAPVSIGQEIALGQKMSSAMQPMWHEDAVLTAYVTSIATQFTAHLRRPGIPYHFHVVDSPEVNAFALPGGEIYVFRGLIEFVENEAELATILGHEVAHVDLRHCVDKYRYELALKGSGARDLGQLVDLSRSLAATAYTQFQEAEADAQGLTLAVAASYDPEAGKRLFRRMGEMFDGKTPAYQRTPAGELISASASIFSSYFRSHPRSELRAQRLEEQARTQHYALEGKQCYLGRKNLAARLSLAEKAFDDEWQRVQ